MENSFTGDAVVVVQARMGSSRLPGKMTADLAGRPLVWHILQRALRVEPTAPVVLATTTEPRDDVLAAAATGAGVAVVRGSEDDVMGRFLQVLALYPARWVVRICGDSPLFDPVFLGRCLALARAQEADVVKFAGDAATLYQGGEVVSARALLWSRRTAPMDPLSREHVTAYALRHAEEHPELLATAHIACDPGHVRDLKLSIDTEDDLARLRALYEDLWDGRGIVALEAAARWLAGPGAANWT